VQERGMMWDDLRGLIRRNQTSNADIRYYRDRTKNPFNIAIFDRKLTRRKPEIGVSTGWEHEDNWRDSHICEAAFFGGEIPMEGSTGSYDNQNNKFIEKPYRGALAVLEIMLNEGCLRRTDELRELFGRHKRRFPEASPSAMAIDLGDYCHPQEANPTS